MHLTKQGNAEKNDLRIKVSEILLPSWAIRTVASYELNLTIPRAKAGMSDARPKSFIGSLRVDQCVCVQLNVWIFRQSFLFNFPPIILL